LPFFSQHQPVIGLVLILTPRNNNMSAAHRSIARLPLEIYTDLICERQDQLAENPELLRDAICNKLKKFADRSSRGGSRGSVSYDSITTVGGLLTRISKPTLLRVLDPILTYGKKQSNILYKRKKQSR
jgi:hypothetical protein